MIVNIHTMWSIESLFFFNASTEKDISEAVSVDICNDPEAWAETFVKEELEGKCKNRPIELEEFVKAFANMTQDKIMEYISIPSMDALDLITKYEVEPEDLISIDLQVDLNIEKLFKDLTGNQLVM